MASLDENADELHRMDSSDEASINDDQEDILDTPRTKVRKMLASVDMQLSSNAVSEASLDKESTVGNLENQKNRSYSSEIYLHSDTNFLSNFDSAYERVRRLLNQQGGKSSLQKKEVEQIETQEEGDIAKGSPSSENKDSDRNSRLQQLIEKKRNALKKEQEDLIQNSATSHSKSDDLDSESADDSDLADESELSKKYTSDRKIRNASKKALLELHRNTARLTRETALKPEVVVKKKVTLREFFQKIGFKNDNQLKNKAISEEEANSTESPNVEKEEPKPSVDQSTEIVNSEDIKELSVEDDSLELKEITSEALDIGQTSLFTTLNQTQVKKEDNKKFLLKEINAKLNEDDIDSELEIEVKPKTTALDNIEKSKLSEENEHGIKGKLKQLAEIKLSKDGKPFENEFNIKSFNRNLVKRAAVMAKLQRNQLEEELKAKGIYKPTIQGEKEEEEDPLERARNDAEKIRQLEKASGNASDEDELNDEEEVISSSNTPSTKAKVTNKVIISDVIIEATQAEPKRRQKNSRVVFDEEDLTGDSHGSSNMKISESDDESNGDMIRDSFDRLSSESIKDSQKTEELHDSFGINDEVDQSTSLYVQNSQPSASQLTIVDATYSQPPPRWESSSRDDKNNTSSTQPSQVDSLVPTQLDSTIPTQIDSVQLNKDQGDEEILEERRESRRDSKTFLSRTMLYNKDTGKADSAWASDLIEEQAIESDDEYAGIGGLSDDGLSDSDAELEVQNMIDDETTIQKGEVASMAQFAKDQEMDRDEKLVKQLMKDVTTGALRKRNRNGFAALDDSDDEDYSNLRREKLKELRRQKLLEDGNLNVLEGDKRKAFLATVEDSLVSSKDNLTWLDATVEDSGVGSSDLGDEYLYSEQSLNHEEEEQMEEELSEIFSSGGPNVVDRVYLKKSSTRHTSDNNGLEEVLPIFPGVRKLVSNSQSEKIGDLSNDNSMGAKSYKTPIISSTQRPQGRKFRGLMNQSSKADISRTVDAGSIKVVPNSQSANPPRLLASLNNYSDFD